MEAVPPKASAELKASPEEPRGLQAKAFRRKKELAPSWESLQRRLVKEKGNVKPANSDRPRLLATVEEVEPRDWERDLARWPELAKACSRLPPLTSEASWTEGSEFRSVLEENVLERANLCSSWESSSHKPAGSVVPSVKCGTVMTATTQSTKVPTTSGGSPSIPSVYTSLAGSTAPMSASEAAERLLRPRTAPYARSFTKPCRLAKISGAAATAGDDNTKASEAQDALAVAGQLARQAFDITAGNVYITFETFKEKLEGAKQNLADQTIATPEMLETPRSARTTRGWRHWPGDTKEELHQQVVEKLDYLWACREVLGERVFRAERQRLELQAQMKGAAKYCNPLSPRSGGMESSRKADEGLSRAEGIALPSPRAKDRAAGAFEFERQCKKNQVVMPSLHIFDDCPSNLPSMNLDMWSIGDAPLLALAASSMKEHTQLSQGQMSNNRLSSRGLSALLDQLGPSTQVLNLAGNRIDASGALALVAFVRKHSPKLKELDLSGNHLDDQSVAKLCTELASRCPGLARICLRDVNLGNGAATAPAIGDLFDRVVSVFSIDLSFNRLQGSGLLDMLELLHGGGLDRRNRRLALDLSWNCLGQGERHTEISRKLADMFEKLDLLMHLDISFNLIGAADCKILADSLRKNTSLWGLHVEGNSAALDIDGSMHILEDREATASTFETKVSSVHAEVQWAYSGSVGAVQTHCWLCGGWVEVVLKFREDDTKDAESACVFLSIDNFTLPLPMTRSGSEKEGFYWLASRFLPPTPTEAPLLVVFKVDNRLRLSKDLPRRSFERPLTIPGFRDGDPMETTEVNLLQVRRLVANSATQTPGHNFLLPEVMQNSKCRPRQRHLLKGHAPGA